MAMNQNLRSHISDVGMALQRYQEQMNSRAGWCNIEAFAESMGIVAEMRKLYWRLYDLSDMDHGPEDES